MDGIGIDDHGDAQATERLCKTSRKARMSVFQSPVVHTPQRGKAITALYLTRAMHVLNDEHFRYGREVVGARDAVLEFKRAAPGPMGQLLERLGPAGHLGA